MPFLLVGARSESSSALLCATRWRTTCWCGRHGHHVILLCLHNRVDKWVAHTYRLGANWLAVAKDCSPHNRAMRNIHTRSGAISVTVAANILSIRRYPPRARSSQHGCMSLLCMRPWISTQHWRVTVERPSTRAKLGQHAFRIHHSGLGTALLLASLCTACVDANRWRLLSWTRQYDSHTRSPLDQHAPYARRSL